MREVELTTHPPQFAAASGATVIATSSSDAKLQHAKSLGATHLINYTTTPDWAAEVLRLTHGRGVDHVLDVGGAATIEQSLTATRHGGLVSLIGYLGPGAPADLVPAIIFGAKTLRGVFQVRRDMLVRMVELVEEKGLRPPVGKVVEWADAKTGFEALVGKEVVGKIVVRVVG